MSNRGLRRLMVLFGLVLACAGMIAAGLVMRARALGADLDAARADGLALLERGEHAAALERLSRYVVHVKDDADALLAYAACQLEVPQPNDRHIRLAIDAATLAASVEPGNASAHEFLMWRYAEAGFATELAETCEALLSVDPDHREAWSLLVDSLIRLGDTARASEAADGFLARFPSALGAHAAYVRTLGGADAADRVLDYWLSDPVSGALSHRAAYHVLVSRAAAVRSMHAGTFAERSESASLARSSAVRASEIEPIDQAEASSVVDWLLELSVRSGDPGLGDLAEKVTDRAIDPGVLGVVHAAGASRDAWWRLDDERAIELARRIDPASTDPELIGWRLFLSVALPDEDLDCGGCETTLESDGSVGAETWRSLAEAARSLETAPGPRRVIERLIGVRGEIASPIARLIEGEAYRRHGLHDSAVGAFRGALGNERAVLLRPRAVLALAETLASRGDAAEADRLFAELNRAGVGGPIADTVFARQLEREMENPALGSAARTAEALLEQIKPKIAARPDDADLAAMHARLLLIAGRRAEGVDASRRLLRLDAPRVRMATALAAVLASAAPSLAEALLNRLPADGPGALDIASARADLEAGQGRVAAGLACLEAVPNADPHTDERLARTLAAYMDRHELPGAIGALTSLSADFAELAVAQHMVISSRAAWEDEGLIRQAVARLRDSTSEDALEWRLAEARADLRFLTSRPQDERDAERARVAQALLDLRPLDPDNGEILVLIAEAFDSLGDAGRASRFLAEAAGHGRRSVVYPTLIRMLLREGDRAGAAQQLDAFAAVPDPPLFVMRERAALLDAFRRHGEAISDLRRLADLGDPDDIAAYARVLLRTGEVAGASAAAARLLRGTPSLDRARTAAGLLLEAGLVEAAERAIIKAGAGGHRAGTLDAEIGRLYLESGRWGRAIDRLTRAYEQTPSDALMLQIAHALLEAGRDDRLVQMLTAHGPGSPDLEALSIALSDTSSTSRLLARMVAAGATAVDDPGRIMADAAGSRARGEIGDEAVLDALKSLCESHPSEQDIWKARVAFAREVNSGQALDTLEAAAAVLWHQAWPERELALLHLGTGRAVEAENAARRMADRLGEDRFEADVIRARIAASAGHLSAAYGWISAHRARLEAVGEPTPEMAILISGLASTGEPVEAERIIEELLGEHEEAAWLYLDSVDALPAGETAAARRWLARLDVLVDRGERAEKRGLAWFRLSRRTGEVDDAGRAFELLTDRAADPQSEHVDLVLASLESRLGRPEEASRRLEAIIAVNPRNVYALNNHANVLARGLGETARALEQVTEAIRLAESSGNSDRSLGSFYHTLAVVHRLDGRLVSAEEALRRGITLAGATPVLTIELADLVLEQGRPDEAAAAVRVMTGRETLTPDLRRRLYEIELRLP